MVAARAGAEFGPDGAQPLVDLGQAARLGLLLLGQQLHPLGVGGEHGLDQAGGTRGRLLADLGHAGAGRQPDLAAIEADLTGDGAQQRALAGAVAADEADPPPRVDAQLRPVQQGAAGDAQGYAIDDEQAHDAGFTRSAAPLPSGGSMA